MILRRLRALLALLLLPPQLALAATPPPAARPALWAVRDADTTIYLFGTIHALPDNYQWEAPAIAQAVQASDRLVIEAIVDQDPANAAKLLVKLGASPNLPPLGDRVPAKDRAKLAAMEAKTGYPPAALDKFESWAAALVLAGVTIRGLGVSSAAGVEEHLKSAFAAAGKPIEGLETTEIQLGFFDQLPEPEQRAFLASVIEEPAGGQEDFGKMLAAWARGDEKGIAANFDRDLKVSSGLRDVLITRRNANWAADIQARLATPGTIFIAVGAGHLAGKGSVIELLEKKGLTVERVE